MDRIIRLTLGLLLVILIAAVSVFAYGAFVEKAYRESLSGTYSYSCTITTGSPLTNVTLFIPVPADPSGNSPVVSAFSTGGITGIPAGWNVTLYDTGKATLVKITTPSIAPPAGTNPYTVTMSADLTSRTAIDTRDPLNSSSMFRPVSEIGQLPCAPGPAVTGNPVCYHYVTSLYADYGAAPGAAVSISATLSGRNDWQVFEPVFNEYTTAVSLQMNGARHGWSVMNGTLTERIGRYDTPLTTA